MKISASTAPPALPYKYRQGQPATGANTQIVSGLCQRSFITDIFVLPA